MTDRPNDRRPSVPFVVLGGFSISLSHVQLVVWTASGKSYADAIIDLLDPNGQYFTKRLYRESCVRVQGLCVKDLRRLGRPMDSVVLLDNYVYSFGFTLDNGVPISPWTGDEVMTNTPFFVTHSYKFVVLWLVFMQIFEVECIFCEQNSTSWPCFITVSMPYSKILLKDD